jgi:hypothetical protein
MKLKWIHESDVIPQGFYIKSGKLNNPEDFREAYGQVRGKDDLVEQVTYGFNPPEWIKPSIEWFTLGFRYKKLHLRIRFVNKREGVKIFI